MATPVTPFEPAPVALAFGDAYLTRLGREVVRLERHAAAISEAIAERHALLADGLTARNLTRFDTAEFSVRRGRTGVTVG